MKLDITQDMELVFALRLLMAAVCGVFIGYERSSRLKEAGVRTHLIVALGACMMMLISKYGFSDLSDSSFYRVDPSRIASQIVTGIGFLGAGIIFVRNRYITGLTTAAGIWATAAIGMAIGAGMYSTALACTGIMLAAQYFLYGRLDPPNPTYLVLRVRDGHVQSVLDTMKDWGITVLTNEFVRKKGEMVKVDLQVRLPRDMDVNQLVKRLDELDGVMEVES